MRKLFRKLFPFNKEIVKETLRIAWPAIVETLFMAMAGLLDSLMVSELGSEYVAAVGLTTQPKFIGLAMFIAISVATSAVIARRNGEKRRDDANRTLVTSFTFVVFASILISAVMVSFADPIIRLCGSEAGVNHEPAVEYFKIIMGGMIFNCIQVVVNSAQRGAGNTKITMYTNITSNTVNVIFNYLLIGGHFGFPALGIKGAAIATVLGTAVSSVMSIISVCKKDRFLSVQYIIREKIRPAFSAFKVLLKFAYSIFIEQILLRIGFLATAIMVAKQGNAAMAAHQAAMNVLTLSFAFGEGLQHAAVALIGKSLGEKNPDKAKTYGAACQAIGSVISVMVAILFMAGGRWIMTLFFEDEPHIVDIGVDLVYIMIFVVLFQIIQIIYNGALRGAGDTLYTAICSTISVTIVRTVVAYFCGYTLGLGINGIWYGILADQVMRFILSSIRFKRGKWVRIKV